MNRYRNVLFGMLALLLVNFIFDYDFRSSIAIGVFVYWVSSLLLFSNRYLPIMELFFCLFSLQFLFGPALSYNGFDVYTNSSYRMKISSENYFNFIIPLFIAFPLGFRVFFDPFKFKMDQEQISQWLSSHKLLPYNFILIGFFAPILTSIIPSSLSFISYLLESFKFIGLFILILSNEKIKPLLLGGIYGGIFISSFTGGMFHDLLIWMIVLGLILSYRYKPGYEIKLLAILAFILFASFIQSIKVGLRTAKWDENENVSIELISNINQDNISENSGFFTIDNIGPQINRINQGWILASTMDNVPSNEPHSNGALTRKYLYSAFMPRFLAPEKLKAGDQNIFNKYSGHSILDDTAMGLGLFTDAYVEFGNIISIIYIFFFGVLYGFILEKFRYYSSNYPILILFSVLAFVYPMRPDCETQTVLGHLFKTIMLISAIFYFYSKEFYFEKSNS